MQITRAEKKPELIEHWPFEQQRRLAHAQLGISVITLAEMRVGFLRLSPRNRQEAENRLATFTPIPLDTAVLDAWAAMMHACKEGGLGEPKHNDVWIAATAKVRGVPLVTCDLAQCRLPRLGDVIYLKADPDSGEP